MLTSIIIITYNSKDYILKCLKSIYKVNGINKAEIIVLDNNSYDNSVFLIQKYYPEVKVIESKINLGFGAGVNKAVKSALGKYIVLLNPDVEVDKNWLNPLIKHLTTHKDTVAVNSKTFIKINNKKYIQNAGNYIFSDGHGRDRGAVVTIDHQQLYEQDSIYYQQSKQIPAFSGVSVAIKKNIFQKFHGFDENMFLYYEDSDLSLRFKKTGYQIWYEPKSTLTHTHSASSVEWSAFFIYQTELNRLIFLLKHFSISIIIKEVFRYQLATLKQLLTLNKRFFLRIRVLTRIFFTLPHIIKYRMDNN